MSAAARPHRLPKAVSGAIPATGAPGLRLAAQGKVNLALAVVGRRADGYHELRSVFLRLALADTLTLHGLHGLHGLHEAATSPDELVIEGDSGVSRHGQPGHACSGGLPAARVRGWCAGALDALPVDQAHPDGGRAGWWQLRRGRDPAVARGAASGRHDTPGHPAAGCPPWC